MKNRVYYHLASFKVKFGTIKSALATSEPIRDSPLSVAWSTSRERSDFFVIIVLPFCP